MKRWAAFLFLFISINLHSQKIITGIIKDAASKQPVSASIFLNNTSIGKNTGADGTFSLKIPPGKYDIIVSSVGYETYVTPAEKIIDSSFITILLKERVKELDAITLEPFEKNGWERWGKFFTENFIGRSGLADGCRILNKEVLRFRNSKTTHQLTVTAAEPLLIENKVLGYRLQYQLEDFNFNFQTRTLFYYGYPFFVDLGLVNKRKAAKWHKSREEVYYGSMMHFMRSAYNNGLGEEGFEMIRIKKIPNERKKLVQESMRSMSVNGHIVLINSTDRNILSEPDFINVTDNKIIPADSITYKIDSTSREMFFTDYVRVFYKPAKAPPDYTRDFPAENRLMISELTLINQHAIKIEKSGNYYMPTDLFTSGFWAWSEKVCSMLPFDYELPANPASQK